MKEMKIGDRVMKYKTYTNSRYCKFGGDERYVPLGSKGTITHISDDVVCVSFDNNIGWSLDVSELKLINSLKHILEVI